MIRIAPLIWMLLTPPVFVIAYMTADYGFGMNRTTSTDYVALIVGLLIGALAWRNIRGGPLAKTMLLIAYVPMMAITLFAAMLLTACGFGDCL